MRSGFESGITPTTPLDTGHPIRPDWRVNGGPVDNRYDHSSRNRVSCPPGRCRGFSAGADRASCYARPKYHCGRNCFACCRQFSAPMVCKRLLCFRKRNSRTLGSSKASGYCRALSLCAKSDVSCRAYHHRRMGRSLHLGLGSHLHDVSCSWVSHESDHV